MSLVGQQFPVMYASEMLDPGKYYGYDVVDHPKAAGLGPRLIAHMALSNRWGHMSLFGWPRWRGRRRLFASC